MSPSTVHRFLPSFLLRWVTWLLHPELRKKDGRSQRMVRFVSFALHYTKALIPPQNKTEGLTQRENGDVWWSVRAEQCVLPGFVERHLLIKHPFDRPHHRLKAVHPEGEGFVWLVVSLLLLMKQTKSMSAKRVHVQAKCCKQGKDSSRTNKPGFETLVSRLQCSAAPHNQ